MGEWQRAEEYSVSDTEHRGIGADAERDREHGDESERGCAGEHAGAVADVAPQGFSRREAPHITELLRHGRDIAELTAGGAPGGGRIGARRFDLGCPHLEVERHLVIDVRVEAPAAGECAEAQQEIVQEAGGHVRSGGAHDERDGAREVLPGLGFRGEVLPSRGGERVKLGPASFVAHGPFGGEHALELEAVEGGVESAFLHAEDIVRRGADPFGDGVSVQGAAGECLEHQHVEGALHEFGWTVLWLWHKPFMVAE